MSARHRWVRTQDETYCENVGCNARLDSEPCPYPIGGLPKTEKKTGKKTRSQIADENNLHSPRQYIDFVASRPQLKTLEALAEKLDAATKLQVEADDAYRKAWAEFWEEPHPGFYRDEVRREREEIAKFVEHYAKGLAAQIRERSG